MFIIQKLIYVVAPLLVLMWIFGQAFGELIMDEWGSIMYEYKCKILRVVDGDTVDIDIDPGFGVWMHKERVPTMGIDNLNSEREIKWRRRLTPTKLPAPRTSPHLIRQCLKQKLTEVEKTKKESPRRILGDLIHGERATDIPIETGHAAYFGGPKEEIPNETYG